MSGVTICEYTDPICPWAWSAEPHRLRLSWTYGDSLTWEPRMVGLAEDPAVLAARFTPEDMARNLAMISARFGMPIYQGVPDRLVGSFPPCRAVVATRLHEPERTYPLLRELRKRCFSNQPIDEQQVIDSAAETVGLQPEALTSWMSETGTEEAFQADMAAAREPSAPALAVQRKLAQWEGGWRYTCPSYVLVAGGEEFTAPGFQPYETYETALANLTPDLEQKPAAESVTEALGWAESRGEGSLATVEVAALTGRETASGTEELELELRTAGAEEQKVGSGSFWTLPTA